MRKNKERMLLFLITCLSIVQISCTFEEKYITENNNSKNYQLFEKKFSDIIKEKEFKKSFSKVAKPNFNGSSKTIMEQQYGFEIDETAIVKEIHQNGIITYTLGIKTDSLHNNQLRNLLVEQAENNQVSAYILSYHLTAPLLPTGHNSFSLNYSTATIEPINYNANQTSRVLLSNGCYYSRLHMCYEHPNGNMPGPAHPARAECILPQYLYYQDVYDCPSEGGGGGTGDSGGTGGGAPADGGSASGGPTSPTAPILPEAADPYDPCFNLKKTTNTYKTQLQGLKTDNQNLSYKGEYGKTFKKESGVYGHDSMDCSDFNYCNPAYGPSIFGGAHSHPRKTDQMFSVFDVFVLNSYFKTTDQLLKQEVVFYMVGFGNGPSYAIKINDSSAFSNMLQNLLDTVIGAEQDDRIVELDKKLENMSLQNENLPREFLRFFNTSSFSLYETKDNFSTWNKLNLDPVDPVNNPVIPIPCL